MICTLDGKQEGEAEVGEYYMGKECGNAWPRGNIKAGMTYVGCVNFWP